MDQPGLSYAPSMLLRAAIEPTASTGDRRVLEVVAASFEQGRVEIDTLTPPGWRRVHVIVTG